MTSEYIPYGRQQISEQDIESVLEVLKSDYLTQGPAVARFEKAICDAVEATYAVTVNSATSALHIACLALGVRSGDMVWTSPVSFVASSNCALYCGASVDFVDIDPLTFNMSVDALETKLVLAEREGKLPKVLIPVHLCGQPCNMKKIHELSLKYDFSVIEDASHAIGGKYCDQPVGNCQYSDVVVFSFHPVKIITTGEGGCVTTNNKSIADKLKLLRSHGITKNPDFMEKHNEGPWYYEQSELGFNYRMTDLQAALGFSQMSRLTDFVARRHELASIYNNKLEALPISLPYQHDDSYSGFHLYVIQLVLDKISKTHQQVFEELRRCGLGVNVHYMPIYLQPYYRNLGFIKGHCPNAEEYYSRSISIPLYHSMATVQQDVVVDNIRRILQ